jgi:hypothetical protein
MANENTAGGPLTATIGEQLVDKGHVGEIHEAEARVRERAGGRTQRRAARGMPGWVALAGAALGWALLSSLARRLLRRR